MEKQKIRVAYLSGFIVKNRCRKEERTTIMGYGNTDAEAITSLKNKVEDAKKEWKKSEFTSGIIFDGFKVQYDDYNMIETPLFPSVNNNAIALDPATVIEESL